MGMSQENIQEEIAKAQQLQQQLQQVSTQKQQLEMKMNDLKNALEEIDKLDEDSALYKNIGDEILVGIDDKDKLVEDLEDRKESTEVRINSLEKKEEKFRENFQEIQQKLSTQLGGMQQGPTGGN